VLELRHSGKANTLREEANRLRLDNIHVQEEANGLRDEQKNHIARIAELQAELNKLQAERNQSLGKIAENTQRVPTEAEHNANILRKYLGQCAQVTVENAGKWGSAAIIADISDNNILTLFIPAGPSAQAYGSRVRCDKVQIVEEKVGSCPVQINVLGFYGQPINYGNAKSWEERNTTLGGPVAPHS
jgi:hypothetical protein